MTFEYQSEANKPNGHDIKNNKKNTHTNDEMTKKSASYSPQ